MSSQPRQPVLKTKHRAVGPRKGTGTVYVTGRRRKRTQERAPDGTEPAAYREIRQTVWDALCNATDGGILKCGLPSGHKSAHYSEQYGGRFYWGDGWTADR